MSKSCEAFGAWGVRSPVIHGMFSVALSGCSEIFGTCGLWALENPPGVTRFEGGGVAENCLYPLGNVRNKGIRRGCHELSGDVID